MKRELISQALNLLDDRHICETATYDPGTVQGPPERIVHMSKRRMITLTVAAVLILTLGTAAYAAGSFGLKDLQVGSGDSASVVVAGWSDTPEEQAAKEWQEYILHAQDNRPDIDMVFLDTDLVSQVGAFSPEAKERLTELLEQYELRLPEQVLNIPGIEGLYSVCGQHGFLPVSAGTGDGYPISGRYYRGGSFNLCDAAIVEGKTVRFDMTRSVKGYFTGAMGYMLNVDRMEEWIYTTSSGVETILNLGPTRASAIIPLENSFVYIHFRSGTEGGYDRSFDLLTKEIMEAFVESIDFDALDSIT